MSNNACFSKVLIIKSVTIDYFVCVCVCVCVCPRAHARVNEFLEKLYFLLVMHFILVLRKIKQKI